MDFYDSLYSMYGCLTGLGRGREQDDRDCSCGWLWLYGSQRPDVCGLGNRPSAPGCAIVYM